MNFILTNLNNFRYLDAWSNFVKAVRLCLQRNMTQDDLNQVQNLLLDFYIHYEKYVLIYI
jgi:uncharacterized protein YebE (UPF0316 family)